MATMCALGYSLHTIERFFLEVDFGEVRTLDPERIFDFLDDFGIDTGENLVALIQKVFRHKGFSPDVTFQELADSGRCKALRIWAADLQMVRPIEFSAEKTPDFSVVMALRASIAVPIYFTPVRHPETGLLLADGGVYDNYPISFLTEEEVRDSLGITFQYKSIPRECTTFAEYLGLIATGYYMPSYQNLIRQHKERTIELPCYEFPSLHLEATLEEKRGLITIGRQAAEEFFKRRMYLGRRHSVV
jgi:predicted acylesterase/phospholipase RssA